MQRATGQLSELIGTYMQVLSMGVEIDSSLLVTSPTLDTRPSSGFRWLLPCAGDRSSLSWTPVLAFFLDLDLNYVSLHLGLVSVAVSLSSQQSSADSSPSAW